MAYWGQGGLWGSQGPWRAGERAIVGPMSHGPGTGVGVRVVDTRCTGRRQLRACTVRQGRVDSDNPG